MEYRPEWPLLKGKVVGVYDQPTQDPDTGRMEPIKIMMRCEACKATSQYTCVNGTPRRWINAFAMSHVHADPLTGVKR